MMVVRRAVRLAEWRASRRVAAKAARLVVWTDATMADRTVLTKAAAKVGTWVDRRAAWKALKLADWWAWQMVEPKDECSAERSAGSSVFPRAAPKVVTTAAPTDDLMVASTAEHWAVCWVSPKAGCLAASLGVLMAARKACLTAGPMAPQMAGMLDASWADSMAESLAERWASATAAWTVASRADLTVEQKACYWVDLTDGAWAVYSVEWWAA